MAVKMLTVLTLDLISILSVVVPYPSSYAQIDQTQQEWLTYEDPILGISIQYPSGWEVTEEPNTVTFRHYNETGDVVIIAAVVSEPPLENETGEEVIKSLVNDPM